MSKIHKIVLDTNFLMIPGQFGVDIYKEVEKAVYGKIEVFICSGSLNELAKISESGKESDKKAANIALKLVEKKKIQIVPTETEHVDDKLVELSQEGYIVATQDLGLKKRLKRYIYLRQKKYVEMRGVTD